MAHRNFELGDNLQQSANDDQAEMHLALLEDSGMAKVERVASKEEKTAATQAATEETAAQKQFGDAVKEFEAAPADQKMQKLAELAPKFEGAIKTADDDYVKTIAAARAESTKLMPAYDAATEVVEQKKAAATEAFSKVPEPEQEKVQALIQAWSHLGRNDQQLKLAIENNLNKYSGLVPAIKEMDAAMNAPAIKAVEQWQEKVATAVKDKVITRMGYGEILLKNGFEEKGEELMKDGLRLMGVPVPEEQPQKPKGLIEAGVHKA